MLTEDLAFDIRSVTLPILYRMIEYHPNHRERAESTLYDAGAAARLNAKLNDSRKWPNSSCCPIGPEAMGRDPDTYSVNPLHL